jgi:glyoxylase-like metal-dependent hydrolase (beta-lactamase superfamily II)
MDAYPWQKLTWPMARWAKKAFGYWSIFWQLVSTWYTYILADPDTKEAIIIDPVIEMVDRDLNIIKDLGLNLKYAGTN